MYDTSQLISDISTMLTDNVPSIVAIAIFLAAVKFIVNWFMYAVGQVNEGFK